MTLIRAVMSGGHLPQRNLRQSHCIAGCWTLGRLAEQGQQTVMSRSACCLPGPVVTSNHRHLQEDLSSSKAPVFQIPLR